MRKAFRNQPALTQNIIVAGIILTAILLCYYTTNHLTGARPGISLVTPVDAVIPFVPAAIFGYMLFLPVFLSPFLLVQDRAVIRNISWGIIICVALVLATFLAVPTRVPRPGIPTQENFLYWLVAFLYVIDNPVNCLPGLMLTIVAFVTFCMWSLTRIAGWISITAATTILISSLLLRQHNSVDCVAGFVVGFGVYRFFTRPVIDSAMAAGFAVDTKDWQKPALRIAYSYFALVAAGLLLFETGLRFNPVLPTN